MNDLIRTWREEVRLSLAVSPQLVVTGNINDHQLIPGGQGYESTLSALRGELESSGFEVVLIYDLALGLGVTFEAPTATGAAARLLGDDTTADPVSLARLLARMIPTAQTSDAERVEMPRAALIVNGASRLRDPEYPHADAVHELLVTASRLAHDADPVHREDSTPAALYNQVIWLADRPQDFPHWFTSADPVRLVSIPAPTMVVREEAARRFGAGLPGYPGLEPDARAEVISRFARLADGGTVREMLEITAIARANDIPAQEVDKAVLLHRLGLQQNPWREPGLRHAIATAPQTLATSVIGQEQAIGKVHRVLAQSYLGLSGAHLGVSHPNRPQGVLFFAGPTGVGKTELAKALARLIFGTADSVVRIDMSEFSTAHSEARLIGAPPGYTGHDAGGELTNAVRERPFSIVLFDEFEKAHPSILDKFLQILEDGRLTDGTGSTVQFSQTLIVFTTNLGIYGSGDDGQRKLLVSPDDSPEHVDKTVRDAIARHFTVGLGKPEWLNRLGENIVVFDFIRPESVPGIVDKFLGNLVTGVRDRAHLDLVVEAAAREQLIEGARTKLDFGGRGIASIVEQRVTEPLSLQLFRSDPAEGSTVRLEGLLERDGAWTVQLS